MKMIRAIVRPEKATDITDGLSEAGFYSMTKFNVFGRGKQKGISVGQVHYDELPKTMIMVVVDDDAVDDVIKAMSTGCKAKDFMEHITIKKSKGHVKIRNSWGTGIGLGGSGYFQASYEVLEQLLMDTWVIVQ